MSPEEELHALKQENQELRAKLAEVSEALLQMSKRVAELEARLSKDSHNSHLPPSSDRFARQPRTRSQCKRSGKKPGGQAGLMGVQMHEGTIRHLVNRCANGVRPIERQIKIALRQAPVVHQDESGLYVAGKRVWMHVTSTHRLTHYQVHAKRGTEALDANGILPGYQGPSVHDGWAAYEGYGCSHALCNVHLLRELIFLEETTKQAWTRAMQHLLRALKRLSDRTKARGQVELSSTLRAKANPPSPLGETKRRWRAQAKSGTQPAQSPDQTRMRRAGLCARFACAF